MSPCPPIRRTFSDERGTGTFHSLGALPRRSRGKSSVFHLSHDDDHSSSLDDPTLPDLHFPTARSPSPPASTSCSSSTTRPASPRSQIQRGASTPVLLSNGKPLKPSLKSASSSPLMVIPPQAQQMHTRTRSEPSTPKNVHFPEQDYGLATVRVYNLSASPDALCNPPNSNGDDTETEGEDPLSTRFPFPTSSTVFNYEIDPTKSSFVPSIPPPANLFLESLNLSPQYTAASSSALKSLLTGSILVRNLAFEKHVAVRFTLDDWQTISEVGAHYVDSPSTLPSTVPSPYTSVPGDTSSRRGRGWDRFIFTIRLDDYAHSLNTRTMWLSARYRINSTYPEPGSSQYGPGGEWWDNNDGGNYRVAFRAAVAATTPPRLRPRRETVTAPISRDPPRPPMICKEHSLSSSKAERWLTPLRTGKLSLCNYAPPTTRAPSSLAPPSSKSSSSVAPPTLHPPSDDETASPTSSTLSTPSVSPITVPRVIIGGQPATSTSKPEHIVDWDWSASGKPRFEELPLQPINPVPDSGRPECQGNSTSPLGRKAVSDENALYNAFVMQWCFAQGPSPNHHPYDACGIMT